MLRVHCAMLCEFNSVADRTIIIMVFVIKKKVYHEKCMKLFRPVFSEHNKRVRCE